MDESLRQPVPITSRDAARILRRRSPIAVFTFILIVIAALAMTSRMKPVYEANASVLLDAPNSGNGISEDLLGFLGRSSSNFSLETEIAKIYARTFLLQVIKAGGLKMSPDELKGRIVLSPGPGGQILMIAARAKTAAEAQLIANTVAAVYITAVKNEFLIKTDMSEERLRNARDQAYKRKVATEKLLHDFTTRVGLINPAVLYSAKNQKTVDVRSQLEEARKNLPLQEQSLATLQKQLATIPPEVVTGYPLNKNSIIDQYHDEITSLQTQRHDMLIDYAPDSQEVKDLDAKIAQRQQTVANIKANKDIYSVGSKSISRNSDYGTVQSAINAAQLAIASTQQNTAALSKQLVALEAEQKTMAPQQLTYEDLLSDANSANEEYQKALLGLIQMDVSRVTSVPYIHILDEAQLPGGPSSPKPLLNLIMAIVLGLFLGVCAALIAEYFAGGFDSNVGTQHLPEISGVPLLGSLALALPAPSVLGKVSHENGLPVALAGAATFRDLASATEDALREIGYCLAHRRPREPAPVILLSGIRGDDSTAALAAQLTATLVRDGMRVTLVDADRTQPRLNRVFGAPDAPGLADVLAGRHSAKTILHVGAGGALRFLAAGSPEDTTPNSEGGLRSVFKELSTRADTDIVFVNGPSVWNAQRIAPLEKAADGMVLLTFTDGGLSPEESIARTRRLLSNGYKPDILGIVIGKSADSELVVASQVAMPTIHSPAEEVNQ